MWPPESHVAYKQQSGWCSDEIMETCGLIPFTPIHDSQNCLLFRLPGNRESHFRIDRVQGIEERIGDVINNNIVIS